MSWAKIKMMRNCWTYNYVFERIHLIASFCMEFWSFCFPFVKLKNFIVSLRLPFLMGFGKFYENLLIPVSKIPGEILKNVYKMDMKFFFIENIIHILFQCTHGSDTRRPSIYQVYSARTHIMDGCFCRFV